MSEEVKTIVSVVIGAMIGQLGVLLRWFLYERSQKRQAVQRREKYKRAVEVEIKSAMEAIHTKVNWISHDVSGDLTISDDLCVEHDGKRLFLGENESMTLSFPVWERNAKEVIEALDAEEFHKKSEEILLARKFVSKVDDLRNAFECNRGEPRVMALAIFDDMLNIYKSLGIQEKLSLPGAQSSNESASESQRSR